MATPITPVTLVDPASKQAYQFTDINQIGSAMSSGWYPIDANGNPMKVQTFEGGYLFNGAPLNVWMGQGWYTGQEALLQPYWQSGQIPVPPASVLSSPTVAMPPAVATQYQAYVTSTQDIFGLPWYWWAAGVGAYLLLR